MTSSVAGPGRKRSRDDDDEALPPPKRTKVDVVICMICQDAVIAGENRVNMCPATVAWVHVACFNAWLAALRTPVSSDSLHNGRAVGTFSAVRCPHCRTRITVANHDPNLAFLDTLGLDDVRYVYLDDPATEVRYDDHSSSESEQSEADVDVWNDGEFTEAVCRRCHQQGLLRQSELSELEQNWPDLDRVCPGCGVAFSYDEELLICAQQFEDVACLSVQHDECPSVVD